MSDDRLVKSDKRLGKMNADQVALFEARNWLEDLMRLHHRGPSDTWTASRDRVADAIGVEPCKLERLWLRWKDMKSVSGGVYRALLRAREAYEAQCTHNEAMAAHHRAVREAIEDGREDGPDGLASILAMAPTKGGSAQASPRSRPNKGG